MARHSGRVTSTEDESACRRAMAAVAGRGREVEDGRGDLEGGRKKDDMVVVEGAGEGDGYGKDEDRDGDDGAVSELLLWGGLVSRTA